MSDRQTPSRSAAPSVQRETAPSVGTMFEMLANPYRRFVLSYVGRREAVSVDEIARTAVARETGRTVADVSDSDTSNVASALYHVHLPKLTNVGLIDYDPDRGLVRRCAAADAADPFLALAERT